VIIEVLTKEALYQFKKELLAEIALLIANNQTDEQPVAKQWYEAAEVRKMLGLSAGKLQQLRIKGMLRWSKIGGVHYYHWEDIQRMFRTGMCSLKQVGHE